MSLSYDYFQYNSIERMEASMRMQGFEWSIVVDAVEEVIIKVFK